MRLQLCYNSQVGLGVRSLDNIPSGQKVVYYYGEVWNTQKAKLEGHKKHSHFLTVPGTGCSIDGSFNTLFPDQTYPDLLKIHPIGAPLMSFTNASNGYKPSNCKLILVNKPMEYKNGIHLHKVAWLKATYDIKPGDELIWDYTYM